MDVTPVVRARAISKSFGEVVALDGVDLDVDEGQVHGLVGPNGAGKTTLLGLFLGLAVPDAGTLEILGSPVRRTLAAAGRRRGFRRRPGPVPVADGTQNLAALAALRGSDARTPISTTPRPGRADRRRRRPGPRLLARDAPAARASRRAAHQAAPAGARRAGQRPRPGRHPSRAPRPHRPRGGGTSIVLSSHRMDDLAALCSEVTLLAPAASCSPARSPSWPPRAANSTTACAPPIPAAARPHRRRRRGCGCCPTTTCCVARMPTRCWCAVGVAALDDLVARLVGAGVAVRELAPVIAPLEAAFLALTENEPDRRAGRA